MRSTHYTLYPIHCTHYTRQRIRGASGTARLVPVRRC
jgi:hypothetical protein